VKAEKGQDRHHDDDQSDKVNDRVHRCISGETRASRLTPRFPWRLRRRNVFPTAAFSLSSGEAEEQVMPLDNPKAPFSLPKLPYDESGLDPVVSAKTISFHYHKHH
jgi:hypothetical protein